MSDTKDKISEKDLKIISPASSENICVFIEHLLFVTKDTYLYKALFLVLLRSCPMVTSFIVDGYGSIDLARFAVLQSFSSSLGGYSK